MEDLQSTENQPSNEAAADDDKLEGLDKEMSESTPLVAAEQIPHAERTEPDAPHDSASNATPNARPLLDTKAVAKSFRHASRKIKKTVKDIDKKHKIQETTVSSLKSVEASAKALGKSIQHETEALSSFFRDLDFQIEDCELCGHKLCIDMPMMKAVGYKTPGPIDRENALLDIEIPKPSAPPQGRDLLVQVQAVSCNPVDTKWRKAKPPPEGTEYGILGYDAVGIIEAIGPDCTLFKVGDRVFYAGDISRPGTNSEFHLVDERIVGRAPKSLDNAQAAALPLTAITAYEMLFHRLKVQEPTPDGGNLILVIGAAGGVGSITLQLLRALTNLTIIGTASRPETIELAKAFGAHHVVNHRDPLAPQIQALGLGVAPGFCFSTTQTDKHLSDIVQLMAPQGRFGLIDDPQGGLDIMCFKLKAISIHWELMFTRPLFQTCDLKKQHKILNQVADLVDAGKIASTLTQVAGKIDAATLKKVHALIESGTSHGKIVLEGF